MRIDSSSIGPNSHGVPPRPHVQGLQGQGPQAAGAAGDVSAQDARNNSPLDGLVAQVRAVPDVRDDVVQAVRQRLAAGEYGTRESAERTAEAMLNSQDWL